MLIIFLFKVRPWCYFAASNPNAAAATESYAALRTIVVEAEVLPEAVVAALGVSRRCCHGCLLGILMMTIMIFLALPATIIIVVDIITTTIIVNAINVKVTSNTVVVTIVNGVIAATIVNIVVIFITL